MLNFTVYTTTYLLLDWTRFPTELKILPRKKRKVKSSVKPRFDKGRLVVTSQDIEQQLQVDEVIYIFEDSL